MAAPFKKRTPESYTKDMSFIIRLRSAIVLDFSMKQEIRNQVLSEIDKLTETMGEIIRSMQDKEQDSV
jgi:hypothetical protein